MKSATNDNTVKTVVAPAQSETTNTKEPEHVNVTQKKGDEQQPQSQISSMFGRLKKKVVDTATAVKVRRVIGSRFCIGLFVCLHVCVAVFLFACPFVYVSV